MFHALFVSRSFFFDSCRSKRISGFISFLSSKIAQNFYITQHSLYFCLGKKRFGEFIQNRVPQRFLYFYERKDTDAEKSKGFWFTLNNGEREGFAGAVKCIYNGKLYSVLSPTSVLNLSVYVSDRLSNPDVLENIGEESNCVIAIITMK